MIDTLKDYRVDSDCLGSLHNSIHYTDTVVSSGTALFFCPLAAVPSP